MSVTFSFGDLDATPCRACGQPYRLHSPDAEGLRRCPGQQESTFYELNLANGNAMDLLTWLGLPAEEYGEAPVGDLIARCRRRLWDEQRNHDPALPGSEEGGPGTGRCRVIRVERLADYLRQRTKDLLKLTEQAQAAGEATIAWG